jgi:hypothetical protein
MDDFYELIDLKSGNLLGDYESAEKALAALNKAARRHGRTAISNFSLLRVRGNDQFLVAMQEDLVDLVDAFSLKQRNTGALAS